MAISIALAIFAVIFSINIGNLIYYPEIRIEKKGYKVEIATGPEDIKQEEVDETKIDIKALFAQANYTSGESTFKKCAICHTINKGEANKVGPNLWGVVGSKVASKQTFAYSDAMANKGKAGDVWSYQELIAYLKSPKKHVPGTKMAFAGIKVIQDRVDLIEFLRTHDDTPKSRP